MELLRLGDLVMLRGGGPTMTVVEVEVGRREDEAYRIYACAFFVDGHIHRQHNFPRGALVEVTSS